jgi:hypothetical protein
VETCLAACQLGIQPVWCLGSSRFIGMFEPGDGVENLFVLGERDNGASAKAANDCRLLWSGRTVREILPPPTAAGKDLNDFIMECM